MNIGNFLTPDNDLVFETEFPEGSGFFIRVKYLSPDEARRISQEIASKAIMVRGGNVVEDNDRPIETEVARLIISWRGLTPQIAASLIGGLRVDAITQALADEGLTEIPCTDDNKLLMVRKAWGFRGHIDSASTTVANYQNKKLEEEIKN